MKIQPEVVNTSLFYRARRFMPRRLQESRPTSAKTPDQLRKLNTLEQALTKMRQCIVITVENYKPCQPVTDKVYDLIELAEKLVKERFNAFADPDPTQRILTTYKSGIYFARVNGRSKIGMSYTDLFGRVTTQIPGFGPSDAFCLMTPDQVEDLIPDSYVEDTIKLELPSLQFHESHKDKLRVAIKTFWAELLCYSCTNCPPGIVGERFLQVPDQRVEKAFKWLSPSEFNQEALEILKSKKYFHSLQTWITFGSVLAALAEKGDRELQQHLATLGRKDDYPTKYMFSNTFDHHGKNKANAGLFWNAVDCNATAAIIEELVAAIKKLIAGRSVKDLSKDEQEEICKLIQDAVGNTQDMIFDTYIPPDDKVLGKGALEKLDSIFDQVKSFRSPEEHRPQDHCIQVEHCLLAAMDKVEPNWTDTHLKDKVHFGTNTYFCTHDDSGYTLLAVPSYFKTAAENMQNETRMRAVESQAPLLMYLCEAGIIPRSHYDEQTRLLKCYAMRLDMKDGNGGQDRSHREARARLFPSKYFPGSKKNNRNVFGHVGIHGIPVAVGQLLFHLLGESLFNDIMRVVYGMETPTPYSLDFECRGIDGKGCRCKSGFDRDTAQVCFVGSKSREHPMYGRFLCVNCFTSQAFYTQLQGKLEELEAKETLTDDQGTLLEELRERKEQRNKQALDHWHDDVKHRPEETLRQQSRQEATNIDPEARQARAMDQKPRDQKKKENNALSKNIVYFSRIRNIKYPWTLYKLLCKSLDLYLRQAGWEESRSSDQVNNVLRATLIAYDVKYPNENVIEYYAQRPGKHPVPVYYKLEFDEVTTCYMQREDKYGKKVRNGATWFCKPKIYTDDILAEALRQRTDTNSGILEDDSLIELVVQQTFDENIEFRYESQRGSAMQPKTINQYNRGKKKPVLGNDWQPFDAAARATVSLSHKS